MSMASTITGPRRVQVWQADAEWPDDVYVVPAEDHDVLQADRDIKAANLQILVEKVLTFETQDSAFQVAPEIREMWGGLFDLARGLKQ